MSSTSSSSQPSSSSQLPSSSQPFLSVIVPFYNEAESASPMVREVLRALDNYAGPWELICVDDGSSDATAAVLVEAATADPERVKVVRLRRNFGQTAALQAGIDASQGELIATLDGDLQNDPHDLPRMVGELLERDLDLLNGWRRNRQDGFWLRRFPSLLANALIRRVTGVQIHDYGCGTKVFRGVVLRQIRLYGEMHRFIPVWIAGVTDPARIGETTVNHRARAQGQSKYGLSRAFRVLLDLLAVFFFLHYRTRPGHFFGAIGLALGFFGSLIVAWMLVVKFGFGEPIGQRPLLFVGLLSMVFSIQLLTTGVLGEFLARVFFNSPRTQSYSLLGPPIGSRDLRGHAGHESPTRESTGYGWNSRDPVTSEDGGLGFAGYRAVTHRSADHQPVGHQPSSYQPSSYQPSSHGSSSQASQGKAQNVFAELPQRRIGEDFQALLELRNVRIERIVSSAEPEPVLYDQDQDEWVCLLQGSARLWIAGREVEMQAGDYHLIPAHTPHRVLFTQAAPPCIWLAVHIDPDTR